MNRLASGGIAVGMVKSQARYDSSKQVCLECIRMPKIKVTIYNKRNLMMLADGICDCCEESKDRVYLVY